MTQVGSRGQPVRAADRTLDILEKLARSDRPLSLGELARDLGIPKSTLHGILHTLTQRRWLQADSTGLRFGLGLRAVLAGVAYLNSDDVVVMAEPVLDWLSKRSGEAVHLGRIDGSEVVYLAKRESAHPLRLFSAIGRRLPAHATALGKAILATRGDEEVDRSLIWPLVALTEQTIIDHEQLHAELDEVRRVGLAVDNGENAEGIRCLAVVLNVADPPQDAISFSVPVFRLTADRQEELVALLLDAKEQIEATQVGHNHAGIGAARAGSGSPTAAGRCR